MKLKMILITALLASLCAISMADTLAPNPVSIDVSHLDGLYVLTDIRNTGSGQLELTLFETETFPGEAFERLDAGDEIVTDGAIHRVESKTLTADGDYIVNQGTDDELVFFKTVYGDYAATGDDDVHPLLEAGKVTLDADSQFFYVMDSSDPEADVPEIYTEEEMLSRLQADPDAYSIKNTYVVFEGNAIRLVMRCYTPWQ